MARKASKKPTTSLSDIDSQIAALEQQILSLESQRAAALRSELESAERRLAEREARYGGGSGRARGSAKRGRAAKAAPGKSGRSAAPKKRRRSSMTVEERIEVLKKIVGDAGSDGISAKKVADKAGLNYPTVLKTMNGSSLFKQVGEKRDSRFYLK